MSPEEKFNTHILPLQGTMKQWAYRLTRDREEAEDVVQDVLLVLWSRIDSIEPYGIGSYCYKSVLNTFINRYRKKKKYPHTGLEAAINIGHEEEGDGKGRYEFGGDSLFSAIEKLPPHAKRAVVLFYGDGLTDKECAEVIGCRRGLVRTHLFQARKKLKKILESER